MRYVSIAFVVLCLLFGAAVRPVFADYHDGGDGGSGDGSDGRALNSEGAEAADVQKLAELYYKRGLLFGLMFDHEKEREFYERALRYDPSHAEARAALQKLRK